MALHSPTLSHAKKITDISEEVNTSLLESESVYLPVIYESPPKKQRNLAKEIRPGTAPVHLQSQGITWKDLISADVSGHPQDRQRKLLLDDRTHGSELREINSQSATDNGLQGLSRQLKNKDDFMIKNEFRPQTAPLFTETSRRNVTEESRLGKNESGRPKNEFIEQSSQLFGGAGKEIADSTLESQGHVESSVIQSGSHTADASVSMTAEEAMRLLHLAASMIQAYVRGFIQRRSYKRFLKRYKAARKIQAVWRGYFTRNLNMDIVNMQKDMKLRKLRNRVANVEEEMERVAIERQKDKVIIGDIVKVLMQEIHLQREKIDVLEKSKQAEEKYRNDVHGICIGLQNEVCQLRSIIEGRLVAAVDSFEDGWGQFTQTEGNINQNSSKKVSEVRSSSDAESSQPDATVYNKSVYANEKLGRSYPVEHAAVQDDKLESMPTVQNAAVKPVFPGIKSPMVGDKTEAAHSSTSDQIVACRQASDLDSPIIEFGAPLRSVALDDTNVREDGKIAYDKSYHYPDDLNGRYERKIAYDKSDRVTCGKSNQLFDDESVELNEELANNAPCSKRLPTLNETFDLDSSDETLCSEKTECSSDEDEMSITSLESASQTKKQIDAESEGEIDTKETFGSTPLTKKEEFVLQKLQDDLQGLNRVHKGMQAGECQEICERRTVVSKAAPLGTNIYALSEIGDREKVHAENDREKVHAEKVVPDGCFVGDVAVEDVSVTQSQEKVPDESSNENSFQNFPDAQEAPQMQETSQMLKNPKGTSPDAYLSPVFQSDPVSVTVGSDQEVGRGILFQSTKQHLEKLYNRRKTLFPSVSSLGSPPTGVLHKSLDDRASSKLTGRAQNEGPNDPECKKASASEPKKLFSQLGIINPKIPNVPSLPQSEAQNMPYYSSNPLSNVPLVDKDLTVVQSVDRRAGNNIPFNLNELDAPDVKSEDPGFSLGSPPGERKPLGLDRIKEVYNKVSRQHGSLFGDVPGTNSAAVSSLENVVPVAKTGESNCALNANSLTSHPDDKSMIDNSQIKENQASSQKKSIKGDVLSLRLSSKPNSPSTGNDANDTIALLGHSAADVHSNARTSTPIKDNQNEIISKPDTTNQNMSARSEKKTVVSPTRTLHDVPDCLNKMPVIVPQLQQSKPAGKTLPVFMDQSFESINDSLGS